MDEIAVDKVGQDVGYLWLRRQGIAKPYLYILIITKAAGYGKDYGQHRYDGQQCGISESRRLSHHSFCSEETNGELESAVYLV